MKDSWKIIPFEDVCLSMTKGPFGSDIKKSLYVPKSESTYKVYIQANAIEKDPAIGDYYISKEYFDTKMFRFEVKPGDYIITCDGTLGKFIRLPQTIERGIISASLLRITLGDQIVPRYFEYLWDGYILSRLTKDIRNSALVHLPSATKIGKVLIPVPSISEQERIVAELDLLTGIIEKQKAQLKELDTLAQSVFIDTCLNQNIHISVKLSDVCSIVKGLVDPNDEPYCDYPHIGGANIESNTGRFVNVRLAREENLISGKYPFDETMILYSKIRPNLNKVALPAFKGVCSADMYPIIPDTTKINKVFLKFILSQRDFLEYAISHSGRANIPKINREDLMDYTFDIYEMSIQQSFAQKIQSIESQKETINRSIAETQKLFDYTMDKYFGNMNM